MRLIHCADLHLDARMTSNLDKTKAKERKVEILHTFTRMVNYAVDNSVDAIMICGDLFDTSNISALARNTVWEAIIKNPELDFYYLKGNHDRDNFLSGYDELPQNLKLFGQDWTQYSLGEDGSIRLLGIELNCDNSGSFYNSLVLDPSNINIVLLHGQESEAKVKDKAEVINLKELRNKNIDYLALGHIHSYKEEKLDARGYYCYCGCLEGRGFDELDEHGFVLLNIDEKKHSIEREFVAFASRKLRKLDVDISGLATTAQIIEKIDNYLSLNTIDSGSLLKIVLCGDIGIECEKDISYVLKHYEESFYFVKIYDETKLVINYEDYRLDKSLKGEFVRQIMEAKDIPEIEKASVIKIGLDAIAGELV